MDALKTRIRHVPDFPKAGILFYDVTTLLRDPEGFKLAIDAMAEPYHGAGIVARRRDREPRLHSRGRGRRSHRRRVRAGPQGRQAAAHDVRVSYELEYGTDSLEMHSDAIEKGQKVLIVDDLLATGGTARATVDLVRQLGGDVMAVAVLIELAASTAARSCRARTCGRCWSTGSAGGRFASRPYTRNVFSRVMVNVWRIRPRRITAGPPATS